MPHRPSRSAARVALLAPLAVAAASALVLLACTGKVLFLGSNGTQSQAVSPTAVSGTVTPCTDGSAHPNVCCQAGPGKAPACEVYPNAPFTACATGATTFPDPRTCCPLDGSGACVEPPPPDAGAPPDSGVGSGDAGTGGSDGGVCRSPCPVGWYPPAGATGGECCQTDPSGGTVCGAPASTSPSCGTGCACPGCTAGTPCPPCVCPTPTCPPPVTECGTCPPGWTTPATDPGLCCSTSSAGATECFSQAVPPGPPQPAVDAGPITSSDGGTGSACGGGPDGSCSCAEDVNGHSYQVSCSVTTSLCSCSVDFGATTTTFKYAAGTCDDPTTIFTSCGFPG